MSESIRENPKFHVVGIKMYRYYCCKILKATQNYRKKPF